MSRLPLPGRSRATRALIALVLAGTCLGAVAYAATRPAERRSVSRAADGAGERATNVRPPRPRWLEVPKATTLGGEGQFRFRVEPRTAPQKRRAGIRPPVGPQPPAVQWRDFECRLDDDEWEACETPHALAGLEPGRHRLSVRALNRREIAGPAAHYAWTQLAPAQFAIEPLGPTPTLMPGEPAQPLPVRLTNPNPEPIWITAIAATVAPDPPTCPGAQNFELIPAAVSAAAPLALGPGASVDLPSGGVEAPAIAMRELPVDQNGCQGITLPLVFSGEAHG